MKNKVAIIFLCSTILLTNFANAEELNTSNIFHETARQAAENPNEKNQLNASKLMSATLNSRRMKIFCKKVLSLRKLLSIPILRKYRGSRLELSGLLSSQKSTLGQFFNSGLDNYAIDYSWISDRRTTSRL